jgi:hypothetical protein
VALALTSCASFELRGVQLVESGEPTNHNVRFGSSTDRASLRDTANSFTRIPGPVILSACCLTYRRRSIKGSRTFGTSLLNADCDDVSDEVFGAE